MMPTFIAAAAGAAFDGFSATLPRATWPYPDVLVRLALALALGLLIGIHDLFESPDAAQQSGHGAHDVSGHAGHVHCRRALR
jgi:hypothetical protein